MRHNVTVMHTLSVLLYVTAGSTFRYRRIVKCCFLLQFAMRCDAEILLIVLCSVVDRTLSLCPYVYYTTHCCCWGCEWVESISAPPLCACRGMSWGDFYLYEYDNPLFMPAGSLIKHTNAGNQKHSVRSRHIMNPFSEFHVRHMQEMIFNSGNLKIWKTRSSFKGDKHQ